MAQQHLSAQAAEGNTKESITPDEDGVFTVQTPEGPEKFCLVRAGSMNDIPKPPPLTVRQQLKQKFYRFRNKYYVNKLAGMSGKLACGVTWRLDLPSERCDSSYIREYGLILSFDDPCAEGVASNGFTFVDYDFEDAYRRGRQEHIRKMKLRNLVPAEPGDPDGFFVKWA